MIELPVDLPADLVPLSWLIGVWEGTGVIDYTAGDTHFEGEFTHRVSFSHDGGDWLNYSATAYLAGADGAEATQLLSAVGFWRLARKRTDADAGPALLPPAVPGAQRTVEDVEALRNAAEGFDIEVALVRADGVSELYIGQIKGPRVDLASDAIVRPATAREYGRAERIYGLVDGHLLWAWDIEALGGEFGSHASARLAKAE